MGLNYIKWLFPFKVTISDLCIAHVWEALQELTAMFKVPNPEICGKSATSLITQLLFKS